MAVKINAEQAERVSIGIAGDLVESVTGLMHLNTWKNLSRGMYGSTVIIKAYEIILYFLSQINNLDGVYGVGGNHDRLGAKEVEANGEAAELIFYFLQKSLPTINVQYDHSILSVDIYGIHYLLCHDDKRFTQKSKAGELLFHYGDKEKFNLIIGGHLHSRITQLDSIRSRKINIASIFTGNSYSEDLGYSSTAGFIIVENIDGLPKVTDYTLQ